MPVSRCGAGLLVSRVAAGRRVLHCGATLVRPERPTAAVERCSEALGARILPA
jgi:hypothetical protein